MTFEERSLEREAARLGVQLEAGQPGDYAIWSGPDKLWPVSTSREAYCDGDAARRFLLLLRNGQGQRQEAGQAKVITLRRLVRQSAAPSPA